MKLEFRRTTKMDSFSKNVPIGQILFSQDGSVPSNCESFREIEAEVAKIKSDLDAIIADAKTFFSAP